LPFARYLARSIPCFGLIASEKQLSTVFASLTTNAEIALQSLKDGMLCIASFEHTRNI
jgi:hypothetical protein